MSTNPLPITPFVSVSVSVQAGGPAAATQNIGLVIGTSTVIPNATRLVPYPSLTAMQSAGFSPTSPEYLAAQLYWAAEDTPGTLYVGLQDTTAIATVTLGATVGTGYVVGDLISPVQGSSSGAIIRVTTIGAEGAVTGIQLVKQGTGFIVGSNLATTGGTGTGCEIDITAIGETPLQAVTACRGKNSVWYGCMVCGSVTADHQAIAEYIDGIPQSPSNYFFATQDAAVAAGTAGNILLTLQALNVTRTFGLYSTAQNGSFPNNIYAAAAVMGQAAGLTTGLAGSFASLDFQSLNGVAPEPLQDSQYLNIVNAGGNVYSTFTAGTWLTPGTMAGGQRWWQTVNRDLLVANIISNVVAVLRAGVVTQTNSGQQSLIHGVQSAAQNSVSIGYISPGTYTGQTVLALTSGTALPSGYKAQSLGYTALNPPVAHQAQPIYLTIIESGAVESVTIAVSVQL